MLHSWLTPKAVIRDVGDHGHGSFAREPIAAGEVVAAFGGHMVTGSQLTEHDEVRVSRSIQIADDLFLLASPVPEDGDLVNHSCDPTCGSRPTSRVGSQPITGAPAPARCSRADGRGPPAPRGALTGVHFPRG